VSQTDSQATVTSGSNPVQRLVFKKGESESVKNLEFVALKKESHCFRCQHLYPRGTRVLRLDRWGSITIFCLDCVSKLGFEAGLQSLAERGKQEELNLKDMECLRFRSIACKLTCNGFVNCPKEIENQRIAEALRRG